MRHTINLDMDGVLADFERHFMLEFGIDSNTISSPEVCKLIATRPGFFETCPVMPGAENFFEFAVTRKGFDTVVLTSCPASCFEQAARDKRAFIRKHFGNIAVIPVHGSRNKHLYVQHPGDILIDDWGKNCEDWIKAGGVAIKHEAWDRTHQQFNEWLFYKERV